MNMIRIPVRFETDSQQYEVLLNAVDLAKDHKGGIVEIGTRRGGSIKMIVDKLVELNRFGKDIFSIDPYGNIEIECTNLNMTIHYPGTAVDGDPMSKEITKPHRFDYDNSMRNDTVPLLYAYCYQNNQNFQFFILEDTEFFKRYSDGVPVYREHKQLINDYGLVFFDGPHDNPSVIKETNFFVERSSTGSVFVYDDIWMYDHDSVEQILFANGFETVEKREIKASYMRK